MGHLRKNRPNGSSLSTLRLEFCIAYCEREGEDIVRRVLKGQSSMPTESFYRLRSAGLMAGDSERDVRLCCQLYAIYLERHLL